MFRVSYLSDIPFNIGFGGKEIQLLSYEKTINETLSDICTVEKLDIWNKDALNDTQAVHLFGFDNWYFELTKHLKNKGKKIIISPTIYFTGALLKKIKLASYLSKLLPIPNYFQYKRTMLSNCDLIIVNSSAEKDQICSLFGRDLKDKTEVVYNGIESDFADFESTSSENVFLQKYGLEEGYLLSVGFLDERKNVINLMKGFLDVYDKIKRKLVLIGDMRFANPKNIQIAKKLLDENKSKIINIPYIKRDTDLMRSAYLNASAHLLVSYLETPGLSNLEAMIFDKPLLVGDCAPVREYFKDRVLYSDPFSIKSISRGITSIADTSKASGNREFVLDNYVIKKIVAGMVEKYKLIIS